MVTISSHHVFVNNPMTSQRSKVACECIQTGQQLECCTPVVVCINPHYRSDYLWL